MSEQRTPEWYKSRCGCVGASRIADIMATTKSGPSASRKNYMAELLIERLTGDPPEGFTSAAMQWGIDHEDEARAVYEYETGEKVETCGFILHPTIARTGASPDGLVGEYGLVEIKCPNTATHLDFMRTGIIDMRYQYQMAWQLICTRREWCDFVSYDPRLPGKLAVKIKRFTLDVGLGGKIENEVLRFIIELDALEKEMLANA